MFGHHASLECTQSVNNIVALYVPNCNESLGSSAGTSVNKVLVVDDDPDLADVAGELLRVHGFNALIVYSAGEALEILEHDSEIDAVFSDVVMPEMTGLQLANIVQVQFPTVRIVLASGYAKPEVMSQIERAFLFIRKPYKIDKVIELLLMQSN